MKVVISAEEIRAGVIQMAADIRRTFGSRPVTVLGVMTGSVVLLADLIRQIELPLRVGVIQARSYRGGTERGELVLNGELLPDVKGRDVVLVDDILDTGHTLVAIRAHVERLEARSIRIAVLLRKRGRQQVSLAPDFVAFEIPDEFVVGYGLDYQDEYRNLPFIAALEPAEIAGGSS